MQNLTPKSCIPSDQKLFSSTPIKYKNVPTKSPRGIKRLSAEFISRNVKSKAESENEVNTNWQNVFSSVIKCQKLSNKKLKSRKSKERRQIINKMASEYSISSIEDDDSGICYTTPISMELCTSLDYSSTSASIINQTKSDSLQTQVFNSANSYEISHNSAYTPITMRNLDSQKTMLVNANALRKTEGNCVPKKSTVVQTSFSKVLQNLTNIPIDEKSSKNYSPDAIEGNAKKDSNIIVSFAEASLQNNEQLSFDIDSEHSYCKRPDFLCDDQQGSMSPIYNKDVSMENENLKMHSPKIQENSSNPDELINCLSDSIENNFASDSVSILPFAQAEDNDLNDQISMDIDKQTSLLDHFGVFSPPVSPIYDNRASIEQVQIENNETIVNELSNKQSNDKNSSMETAMHQSAVLKPSQLSPSQNCRRSARNRISPEEYKCGNGKQSDYGYEIVNGVTVRKFIGLKPSPLVQPVRKISKSKTKNKKRGRPKKTLTTTIERGAPSDMSLQFSEMPRTQLEMPFPPLSNIRVEQSRQTVTKSTFESNNIVGLKSYFEWLPLNPGISTTSYTTDKFGENEETLLGKIKFEPKAEKTKLKTGNYTTFFTVDTGMCLLVKLFMGSNIYKNTISCGNSYTEIPPNTEYSITNLRNEFAILNFTITKKH